MKGIILAGGTGTRLYPATLSISKQIIPIYDKPMVYYPLTTLMLAGITDILIITMAHQRDCFETLLGDGSKWGVNISYASQEKPEGLAQAFIIGEEFIGDDKVALVLGDNILYGDGVSHALQKAAKLQEGATIFGYYVNDPERYGVLNLSPDGKVIDIIEKPTVAPSNYAVIGLYFYDNQVVEFAKRLKPSHRGELEVTDLNLAYLQNQKLQVELLSRGIAWLDTGTHRSMLDAANFIHVLEERQGLKIGCPEEVAWRMNYINNDQLQHLAEPLMSSGYGQYLLDLLK